MKENKAKDELYSSNKEVHNSLVERVEKAFKKRGLTPNWGSKTGYIAIFPRGNKSQKK